MSPLTPEERQSLMEQGLIKPPPSFPPKKRNIYISRAKILYMVEALIKSEIQTITDDRNWRSYERLEGQVSAYQKCLSILRQHHVIAIGRSANQ